MNNPQYHFALDLLSHFILTKPRAVQLLLEEHGTRFNVPPSRERLIEVVLDHISTNDTDFITDMDRILQMHMQYNGRSMLALTDREYDSFYDDENYDNWIVAAIGAVAGIGSTLINANQKKKARRAAARAAEAETKELEDLERKNIARKRAIAKQQAEQEVKARMALMQQKKSEETQLAVEKKAKRRRNIGIGVGLTILGLTALGYFIYKSKQKAK